WRFKGKEKPVRLLTTALQTGFFHSFHQENHSKNHDGGKWGLSSSIVFSDNGTPPAPPPHQSKFSRGRGGVRGAF
ncbi:hypothetical protein, partial [uncultured Bilophila sp.]|uniref:hypothetical protein n=1 Tax=uncultured Bilophila sp. TaxID=529385 RepID=UPI00280A942E